MLKLLLKNNSKFKKYNVPPKNQYFLNIQEKKNTDPTQFATVYSLDLCLKHGYKPEESPGNIGIKV